MERGYVISCHPDGESFTNNVALRIIESLSQSGIETDYVDLYHEDFDPSISRDEYLRRFSFDPIVQHHVELLEAATRIAIVHPDWWGAPPARLKGWVDRVFRPGVAYEFEGEDFHQKEKVPLLSGKRAMVFTTTDESLNSDTPSFEQFWERVLNYCGVDGVSFCTLYDFHSLKTAERFDWLASIDKNLRNWFDRPV